MANGTCTCRLVGIQLVDFHYKPHQLFDAVVLVVKLII